MPQSLQLDIRRLARHVWEQLDEKSMKECLEQLLSHLDAQRKKSVADFAAYYRQTWADPSARFYVGKFAVCSYLNSDIAHRTNNFAESKWSAFRFCVCCSRT